MAHQEQQQFCQRVREKFPAAFVGKRVLDIGALDVNGNNRSLFTDCDYTGLDVVAGKNVDVVRPAHLHDVPSGHYDTIITTEALEHDFHWMATLKAIRRMLATGGLFLGTCAAPGRERHGTQDSRPSDCPGLPWPEHYRNISEEDIRWRYGENYPMEGWGAHHFELNGTDLYWYMVRA